MELKQIRKENQQKTFALLKKGKYFCKDLAESIGVSNVSMYNIIEDFITKGIVRSEATDSAIGRKPVTYTLNENYGAFAAIDFTPPCIKICVHNILGKRLIYREIPIIRQHLDITDLQNCINMLRELLMLPQCGNLPLRNITISTPGRINPDTGYFSIVSLFENFREINLQKIFKETFQCPVYAINNTQLAMIAAIHKYELQGKSIIFLYIDESIGSALCLDGQIRAGDRNLSGEISFSRSFDDQPISHHLRPAHITGIYKKLILSDIFISEKEQESRLTHTIDDVIRLYKENDRFARAAIEDAASFLSILINNFQSLVDCNYVIVHTYLAKCGKELTDRINTLLHQHCSAITRNLIISDPYEQIFIDGCIDYGIDTGIINCLQL